MAELKEEVPNEEIVEEQGDVIEFSREEEQMAQLAVEEATQEAREEQLHRVRKGGGSNKWLNLKRKCPTRK